MKRNLVFVLLLTLFGTGASAQLKVGKLLKAGGNLISAVTLTDADIAEMSKSAVEKMDQENQVDTSDYHRRLQRLTENISVDGLKLNFKVYLTKDVNAFACGDGSVRVYSALMDMMSDSELMAIIGHEIGHVARTDTKDALKNAYLRSAAQNAAGSVSGSVAARLSESQLAELANSLAQAQYSQKQEYDADEYGFEFCLKNNVDPYAMYHALDKLADMSKTNRNNASAIVKAFATHPDSYKRAQRMKEKADALQH